MIDEHTTLGSVNDEGKLRIFNKHLFDQFCKDHPGKCMEISFRIVETQGKNFMYSYYNVEIIKKVQTAMLDKGTIWSKERTHEELCSHSPFVQSLEQFKEMSKTKLGYHFDYCIMYAAENLNTVINDPGQYETTV